MIPKNIFREHLLKAIEEIDELGIPQNAHSSTYDVLYDGKRYPPKLVASIANKYANGKEIDRNLFRGGIGTDAFNLLEREKFNIEKKNHDLFSWVKTHNEIVAWLRDKQDKQESLISLLKNAGVNVQDDKDVNNKKIPLSEIDPFTFFCYIHIYGEEKRLKILQKIADELGLEIPQDEKGIPTAQAQRTWLFPFKAERDDEIEVLWEFFFDALDNKLTDDKISEILSINGIGETKLTELLFYIMPETYFPINGPSKPYLKDVLGINPNFKTYTEYLKILEDIRNKSDTGFPEISFQSWKYQESKKEKVNYWVVNGYQEKHLKYDLANNVFVMQFQYGEQKLSEVTNQLRKAGKIKAGDKVLLYNSNKYYAHSTFQATEKGESPHTLSSQITKREKRNEGELHFYDDADCYFEELTYNNGFDGEFGQRLAINGWEDINVQGIQISGIDKELKSSVTTDTILQLKSETFFNKVLSRLESTANSKSNNKEEMKIPLNQILYGPPGTGKTYATKELAISIAKPDFEFNTESKLSYREQINELYHALIQSKQIVFTTFHQSLGYEDFIEGIKPETNEKEQVIYKVKPGIFKELCDHAEGGSETIEQAIDKFIETIEKDGEQELMTSRGYKFKVGYNGGATFRINPEGSVSEKPDYPASIDNIKKLFIGKDMTGMYNPSYVKSILKFLKDRYGLKDNKKSKTADKNYVIIIDEINRGNVSSIFGELITLLEPDKRKGNKEAVTITLPYSKEPFSVPSNVYVIGTMNTADRSVEALDAALRRRFTFKEIMPNPSLLHPGRIFWNLLWDHEYNAWNSKIYKNKEDEFLKFVGADDELYDTRKELWSTMVKEGRNENQINHFIHFKYTGIRLDLILKTINRRIELLLDCDHTIGHSYFFEVYTFLNMKLKLKEVFQNKIIPLLQEYFYGDYSKIGLVLGGNFIELDNTEANNLFPSIEGVEIVDIAPKFKLKTFTDEEFESALVELQNYD